MSKYCVNSKTPYTAGGPGCIAHGHGAGVGDRAGAGYIADYKDIMPRCWLQVKVDIRLNTAAGLGSKANHTASMDDGGTLQTNRRKTAIMIKTRQRFNAARAVPSAFQPDSDSDSEMDGKT